MSEHGSTPEVHSLRSIWNSAGDASSVSNNRSNAFVAPVHVGSVITRPSIDCSVLRTGAHVSVAVGDSAVRAAVAFACAVGSGVTTNGATQAGSITGSHGIGRVGASTTTCGGASFVAGDFERLSPQATRTSAIADQVFNTEVLLSSQYRRAVIALTSDSRPLWKIFVRWQCVRSNNLLQRFSADRGRR